MHDQSPEAPAGVQRSPESIFAKSRSQLSAYHRRHEGGRCVIIGNGPSLRSMDLSFLKHEITFGMNRINLLRKSVDFTPTYFVAINKFVLEQSAAEIAAIPCPKFLSPAAVECALIDDKTVIVPTGGLPLGETAPFLSAAGERVWEGFTVTYMALQLAHYMGFSEVILIGVDHNFQTKGPANALVVSEGDDPNHFDASYFGKGYRWQLPDLHNSSVAYRMAAIQYERTGKKVVDATSGGALTIFPKIDYQDLFFGGLALDVCIAKRAHYAANAERANGTEAVLETYPESAEAWRAHAAALTMQNQLEHSLHAWQKAIELAPEEWSAIQSCVDTLTEAGLPALGARVLEALLLCDPENRQARSRAQTQSLLAKMQRAPMDRNTYRTFEALARSIALTIVIDGSRRAGAYDLAQALCVGLLDFPHDPRLFNRQAEIFYELGFIETAGKMFLGLARQFPRYDEPYANLGRISRENGDTTTAEMMIQRALELNPRNELALSLAQ